MDSNINIHKELIFEKHIVNLLINEQNYLERDSNNHYDKSLAIDKELFIRFLKTTQPDTYRILEKYYKGSAQDELFNRFENSLKKQTIIEVIKGGIKLIPNINFNLCFFKPASGLNKELINLYESNILSVIRQVKYSHKNENAIDLVIFLNGIAIITIEVKNLLTGQSVKHAERQYKRDRNPIGEPLLTFKRGAIVHFGIDQKYISMTSHLENDRTIFLPFNRGNKNGAGNPDITNENKVAFMYKNIDQYKAILSKEILLNIISDFIFVEKKDKKEKLIFPRFHQLNVIRKLIKDIQLKGIGSNYLIQHSAGSGKSNTITWLADHIINLHDNDNKNLFDTAIIVTDRLSLDRSLQKIITEFSISQKTDGLVKNIDGTSKDLKKAIEDGCRIIVTTIQKFGTDHLFMLAGQSHKRFAIIIDEAHSSQSGKSSQLMTDALTREEKLFEEVDKFVLNQQKSRGPQENISFFAFTATPRNVTIERFGTIGDDKRPYPFDLYSMRQAIEEGFILDVLQNYMTYNSYYKLEKTIITNPSLSQRRGQSKVARFASLHPTAIDQKVEVIVEHFRLHVQGILKGSEKAMLVTQSREHAFRYWKQINSYIKVKNYKNLKAIVAFSGTLRIDGIDWTESNANGFPESELPQKFNSNQIQILVVADKYQTGFDQPKLVSMYIDKNLFGLQAVQTLSRLNRIYPNKKETFILDFRNSIIDIQRSFMPYFEGSLLEERTDLNQIYDLANQIKSYAYINQKDIDSFSEKYFVPTIKTEERVILENIVRKSVTNFEADKDNVQKEEFRLVLRSFLRFYNFVSQIVYLNDESLEKLFVFISWLIKLLPSRNIPADIHISDEMINLVAFKLDKDMEGNASLISGQTSTLSPINEFAMQYTEEEELSLSEIIDSFNDRYGTDFSREDLLRFERINNQIMDENMKNMMLNNPADVVYNAFAEKFLVGIIKSFQNDQELKNIVMKDPEVREKATRHFFLRARKMIK